MRRMSAEYTEAMTRWFKLRKESKTLAHPSHEPKREDYGLDEWEASKIKEHLEREINRTT